MRVLHIIFDSLLEQFYNTHSMSPLLISYALLGSYIEQFTTQSEGIGFSSRPYLIFPNTNIEFITRAIEMGYSLHQIQEGLKKTR